MHGEILETSVFGENAKTLARLNSPGMITKSGQGGGMSIPQMRKGKVALSSGKLNPGRFCWKAHCLGLPSCVFNTA